MSKHIIVKNAHQNNLKQLDLTLPHGELIVITGVSGSGKSTLAFDTIYAEGQRRYVETFSPYARQFLDRMDKPSVDSIEGIPPAIAIDQTNPVRTSRSTVGTMTELNDHIKLLFARTSSLFCGGCGQPVQRDSAQNICNGWLEGNSVRAMVTFSVPVPDNFSQEEITDWLGRQGYTRTHKQTKKHIEVIQDRLRISKENIGRFTEAVETALRFGQGKVQIYPMGDDKKLGKPSAYSVALQCEVCKIRYKETTPSSFSFNSPIGACEECRGFGRVMGIDHRLVIPDHSKTLADGAIKPFQTESNKICQNDLVREAKAQSIPLNVPWGELSSSEQDWVVHGDGGKRRRGKRSKDHWYGIDGFFSYLERKAYKMHVRVFLSKYRSYETCTSCEGARLKPESLNWRVGSLEQSNGVIAPKDRYYPANTTIKTKAREAQPGLTIVDMMRLPLSELQSFVDEVVSTDADEATTLVLSEMRSRLLYLNDVGLGYLTLNRQSRTLSGGEVQRINLTTALGTSLVNTLFVLDEPSIGLHPRDMDRIVRVLQRLRDAGNTLIVVEHDPQVMFAADRIIDMGPGPGQLGGSITFNGKPEKLLKSPKSLTAKYLAGDVLASPEKLKRVKSVGQLTLKKATGHNLQNITVKFPLNRLVVVTGPSGSGKSTLIHDTLYLGLLSEFGIPKDLPEAYQAISGLEHIDHVVMVDQSPIGKSARSNPVSYTGAFEAIRKVFEKVPEAKERGYKASSFSFNSGMRCPVCSGNGFEHVEMQFLSDVYLRCGECQGKRYRPELLDIKVFSDDGKVGKSISDVLNMTVDEALAFFHEDDKVTLGLKPLTDVGLGYVQLGQPVPTLSGGEAQRLKLAAHLVQAEAALRKRNAPQTHTLFLFDEPTTGLHFDDIAKLLGAFEQLIDKGHSLVVIEHNLDVIHHADWLIDLGPEGGADGGQVMFVGKPNHIVNEASSATGQSLTAYRESTNQLRLAAAVLEKDNRVAEPLPFKNPALSRDISVRQARENNLKNIDIGIPRDKLTVITGMSGSGKSTLAFDIVFNEGQRRYLESLNAYARQFVQPAARPDVDAITGIPPTVAIEQRTSRGGRKSTVATMTEIYHFLRLMFVKLGEQYCPECEVAISAQSIDAITAQVMKKHKARDVEVFAPLIIDRKGYYTDLAKWALKKGFTQLRVDGELCPTDDWPRLDRFKEHSIDLPVGTATVSAKTENDLQQLIQLGLDYGSGVVKISKVSGTTTTPNTAKRGKNGKRKSAAMASHETLFSTHRACPSCQTSFPELDPRMFSYNSKHGWCPACYGTGIEIPPMKEDDIHEGADIAIKPSDNDTVPETCDWCEGRRLKPESLNVYFKDYNIADFTDLSIQEAVQQISALKLNERETAIARDSLQELISRLKFLDEVGLSYLHLNRAAPTLSGGEAQRIRLAAQLGSNLRGVCYILDEPTIGLHPRDNRMLLDTLGNLRRKGNTIVVVEHDEETISSAEHIIDIGPGAGVRGGEVVATGSVAKIKRTKTSVTGRMLANPLQHPIYKPRGKANESLVVKGANLHNLKNVNATVPLRQLVCVSGVSGSGKSTLVRDVLHDNLQVLNGKKRKKTLGKVTGCKSIEGWQSIDRVLEVDQTPIGKTSRSCPATYIGFWDNIRRLFSDTTEARIRGYSASRFSFNVSGGRCDECEGKGMQRIEMSFLPDVKIPCEVCNGQRFNQETLSVLYRDKSIGDVLSMNVDDAVVFFEAHSSIHHTLKLLQDVGLGYLTLGQQSPTLSGGEAQRIKLVSELAKAKPVLKDSSGRGVVSVHTLYVLDEPTVGLHMADVEKLIHVLHHLVEAGNSVVVIEHNLDIIAEADYVLDMGPEGGDGGGRVITKGKPAQVAKSKTSRTAPFLIELLERG